ncbi:MAG TPA: YnfA family protein [Streptosporangiaceae bacterium]|nr:YnfA family protein [Streptosporangiaceae bacterium]
MTVARSVGLFIAAGLAEIGGGYLIWRWLRDGAPVLLGVVGAIVLVIYGIIPTLQRSPDFGRIYAAYGGVFVVASLLWGWGVDGSRPDRWEWTGAAVVLAGVGIIYFAPRSLKLPFTFEPDTGREPARERDHGLWLTQSGSSPTCSRVRALPITSARR